MTGIDAAADAAARGEAELDAAVERFVFLSEILGYHARGEQLGAFPLLDVVAPDVSLAYAMDHQRLDEAFDALSKAVTARDAVQTARATAALKFHLDTHLAKEEAHMFRLIQERVPEADQVTMINTMSSQMPASRVPEFNAWIYPLLDDDDREGFTRALLLLMPFEVFAPSIQSIREATGDAGFAELTRRMPELAVAP
jgi:hypothetical protein